MNLGITDGFRYLADKLIDHTKNKVTMGSMKKEDLEALLKQNIQLHGDVAYALKLMDNDEMHDWMRDCVRPELNHTNSRLRKAYDEYVSKLNGQASADERKRPLGSLAAANGEYKRILEEILKKVDKFLAEESVTLQQTRLTQFAILGILRESNVVVNFTMYLYAFFCRVANGTDSGIPRYREVYILDNLDRVASAVTKIRNRRGAYAFLNDSEALRRQGADLVLGASGKFDFHQFIIRKFYTPDFIDCLLSALSALNIFDAVGNFIADYKLDRHNRNKEIKSWLENHVSLLRLELEGKDETSPEYIKLVNIIKAYDEKIADYDERIQKFEEDD